MKSLFFSISRKGNQYRTPKQKIFTLDRWLLIVVIILSFFGVLMVYDASVAIAIRDFSDQYHFVREQLRWVVLGYIVLAIFSFVDYHHWYKLALPILLVALVLLVAVFIPGIGVRALGAHRWINLGVFTLQPAELAKLALVIYLSAWFSHQEKGRFGAFVLLLGMVVGLVVLEPDLGTSIIILSLALLMYFLSGSPLRHLALLSPVVIGGVIVLALIAPYRLQRLTTYFNIDHDPLGSSYQIRQALLALGSGGWTGVGIGKSRQKYEYLPEANTDSIFAIIGEEVGFLGAGVVIALFFLLIWRGFRIASRAPDTFGRLLALGIASWVGMQAVINIAAIAALVPLTGVPLPLISYGGSSLVAILGGMGILLNISKQRKNS